MMLNPVFVAVAIILGAFVEYSSPCSCMKTHPQEQYCKADFVVLARIKRQRTFNNTVIYKIKIRKDYKLSEKAYVALKSGRLLTSKYDNMCGLQLEVGKLYAITGRVVALKAYVNMCGFAEKWENITKRQRKGLRKMYRYGCTCRIRRCWSDKCSKSRDTCNWSSPCHIKEGICLRQSNTSCKWTRNNPMTKCLKSEHEQLTISRWSG